MGLYFDNSSTLDILTRKQEKGFTLMDLAPHMQGKAELYITQELMRQASQSLAQYLPTPQIDNK